ncbi:hypothetical protein BYZ73_20745 [Rhodovulum viride]|uniref:Uncharacterized protein n=1 Tax=Rhodovulum viride TaxID=1231134 RepID=A0ABX9DAP7_9RHOB|nr:hypothetical protein BYZ73_20745 [Rhodovulum viride]
MIAALTIAILTVGVPDLKSHWYVWAYAILFLLILGLVSFALESPKDASRITRILKRRDGPMLYTATVSRVLNGMPRILTPENAEENPLPSKGILAKIAWWITPRAVDQADIERLQRNPWSWPVLDFALKLAVLYPLLLAFVQWGITGRTTGIGSLPLFLEEERDPLRYAAIGGIALMLVSGIVASATQRPKLKKAADIPLLFGSSLAVPVAFGGLGGVAVAIAGGGAVALAVIFAGSFAVACAVAFAITAASISAVSGEIGILGGYAVGDAAVVAVAFAGIAGIACQYKRGLAGYAILLSILFAASFTAILMLPDVKAEPGEFEPRILLLLLGVFPIVNAVFDYFSYGVTIWLVRKGASKEGGGTLLLGAADVLCAAMIFFALSASLVAIIEMINRLAGGTVFDVAALLEDIEGRPEDHWWVFGMIFSTLIPTLVHLFIVALSAITWLPPKARERIEAGIAAGKDDGGAFQVAALATALIYTAYAALITYGVVAGLTWLWSVREPILTTYLNAINWWAKLIGAIPAS